MTQQPLDETRDDAASATMLPPWWAFMIMLVLVGGAVIGLVVLVLALGGRVPPAAPPRLEVITADTTQLARLSVAAALTPAASLEPITGRPQVTFQMSGPVLPTPVLTPTPEIIAIGKTIIVIDVGAQQLNVRDRAGVNGTTIVFRAPEQSQFVIAEGPVQADGLTWWRIQDPTNATRTGWAASNYLQALPSEPE